MPPIEMHLLLALCMFGGAALYSSVGHAGASSYIALMALFGVAPAVMRPTALVMNILVALLVSAQFLRAGQFRWRTLWPFLISAIPAAFLGGYLHLPTAWYKAIIGIVLLLSAARLFWPMAAQDDEAWHDPPIVLAVLMGVGLGLLAGLTGTGGGIFLSPLLIFMAWAPTRTTSGVSAVFILCNSIAGLLGNLASVQHLPAELPLYAGAALLGAALGTTLGIKHLPVARVRQSLGLVMLIAGLKMLGAY